MLTQNEVNMFTTSTTSEKNIFMSKEHFWWGSLFTTLSTAKEIFIHLIKMKDEAYLTKHYFKHDTSLTILSFFCFKFFKGVLLFLRQRPKYLKWVPGSYKVWLQHTFTSQWSFSSILPLLMEPYAVPLLGNLFRDPTPQLPSIHPANSHKSHSVYFFLREAFPDFCHLLLKHHMVFLFNHCILCNLIFIWIIIWAISSYLESTSHFIPAMSIMTVYIAGFY